MSAAVSPVTFKFILNWTIIKTSILEVIVTRAVSGSMDGNDKFNNELCLAHWMEMISLTMNLTIPVLAF